MTTVSTIIKVMVSSTAMSTEQRHAALPTANFCHPKEVLLFHRAEQLGCSNQYGWGSSTCDAEYEWGLQIEQRVEQLLEPSDPEQQLDAQPLLIGPPPGLELASAVSHPSLGKNDARILTTDAMSVSCGRENISREAGFAGLANQGSTLVNPQTTPKSGLHICLADCIDDTSTVASESSPALFPRDLGDAGSTHSSPMNLVHSAALFPQDLRDAGSTRSSPMNLVGSVKKDSPRTVPSLVEALNFAPKSMSQASMSVPSLAEALNFAHPTPTSRVTPKTSTPISLDAMLDFGNSSPAAKHATTLQENAANEDAWKTSQAPLDMAPSTIPLGGVCPWWWHADATAFWPAGAWGHPMHANNINGIPAAISRTSCGTTNTSEVFQI